MPSKNPNRRPADRRSEKITFTKARQLIGMKIRSYSIGAWCPTPDGTGPTEAVALSLKVEGIPHPMVMRFKSPEAVDDFCKDMQKYKNEVWPKIEKTETEKQNEQQ